MCTQSTALNEVATHTDNKQLNDIALPNNIHLRATGRHLPYVVITQCYLPPDTSDRAPLTPGDGLVLD